MNETDIATVTATTAASATATSETPIADRLERMFYQLLDVMDRQVTERQLIAKEKEEQGKLIQLLIGQTKEIGQYENGIRKRIQDCIKESAGLAMEQIVQSVAEKSDQSIEQAASKIGQMCQTIEKTIAANKREKAQFSCKIIAVAILSGVLSSFLMAWLLIPKPVLPLTAEQISYLQEGEMLVQMWPKLTKQEKERLKSILHEIAQSSA